MVSIQWYPGHMDKARRDMLEALQAVDMVIEVRDARVPFASANPILDDMAKGKPRLIILSKRDLADAKESERWMEYFTKEGHAVLALDLRNDASCKKQIIDVCNVLTKPKRDKMIARGIKPRAMRAMACGIPNSGKSTLINCVSKKKAAKTADKPGVTRGLTWIHADESLDILDTPGVLWPKFEDPMVGILLAATGAINENILDLKEVAIVTLVQMKERYGDVLKMVFQITNDTPKDSYLACIAKARNFTKANGESDIDRAAITFLHDLRKGKYGGITLETAP